MYSIKNDSNQKSKKLRKTSSNSSYTGLDSIRMNYEESDDLKPQVNTSKRKKYEQDDIDSVETPKQKRKLDSQQKHSDELLYTSDSSLNSNNKTIPNRLTDIPNSFDECYNRRIPNQSIKSSPSSKYDKDLEILKRILVDRKAQLENKDSTPKLILKSSGLEADLTSNSERTPIIPCDVQNLILQSQLTHFCPRKPKWIRVNNFHKVSGTTVLLVEGISAYDYISAESSCPTLQDSDVKVEMVSPFSYNSNIIEELCAVSLTQKQKKSLEEKFGKEICAEALMTQNIIKVLRSAFSITSVPSAKSEDAEQKISVPEGDRFPRTELLLSAWQLIEEGYPLPYGSPELVNRYSDYVMTKDRYEEVTASSPMWALDCEMCLTRAGNELTRVSVVNEQHETVYESFCLPPNPIKDYLTQYSGITAEMLAGVTTRLEDIQRDLRKLFPPDLILVGQSLNGDLHALKMMHPYIIDTSVIYNLTGQRRRKSKLSKLTLEFLNEAIQQRGAEGHDSVEDSLASLKLVQHKLTKSIEYGDAVLSGLGGGKTEEGGEHHGSEFKDLQLEVGPTMATSLFKHFAMRKKKSTVIAEDQVLFEYGPFLASGSREDKRLIVAQTAETNAQTVEAACRATRDSHFTLAHVKLERFYDEDVQTVDRWTQSLLDAAPLMSLCVVVFVGSHTNFANGACFLKLKTDKKKIWDSDSCVKTIKAS